ncbi:MAG: B12-binding domain-containing radical SAM protein, partial [Candidatus Heimdallarchaeota archaeon]
MNIPDKNVRLVTISFPGRDLNLAPVSLKSYALKDKNIAEKYSINISQYEINTPNDVIFLDLFNNKADIYGFTAYVWNIDKILQISKRLKSVYSTSLILLGGPEVTGIGEKLLEKHKYLDFIFVGEGEYAFKKFLEDSDLNSVPGLVYRNNGSIYSNPEQSMESLNDLSLPYETKEYRDYLDGSTTPVRAAIETSRGCPFACAYCTWGQRKMRYFALQKLKPAFIYLFNHPKVKTIYITDSNPFLKKRRTKELLEFIIEANVHKKLVTFEASPEYINDEQTLDLIMKLGNEEFAFGVQSTSPQVLDQIHRRFDSNLYKKNIRLIREKNSQVEMWFSLIIGLPGDTYNQFLESVDFVLNLSPTGIYFHELLCLPGSALHKNPKNYGIEYQDEAPHKVTKNNTFPKNEYNSAKAFAYFVYLIHRSGLSDRLSEFNKNKRKNKRLVDIYCDFHLFLNKELDILEGNQIQNVTSWFFEQKATNFLKDPSNKYRLNHI